MSKPKRIKAYPTVMLFMGDAKTTPVFVLRQSDIRALAEQMAEDYWNSEQMAEDYWNSVVLKNDNHMLYALKRAGITPGKERAK